MTITRRSLLTGFAGLLAAPAIIRASSLMPVKAFRVSDMRYPNRIRVAIVGGSNPDMVHLDFVSVDAGEQTFVGDLVTFKDDNKAYRVHPADADVNVFRMGFRVG